MVLSSMQENARRRAVPKFVPAEDHFRYQKLPVDEKGNASSRMMAAAGGCHFQNAEMLPSAAPALLATDAYTSIHDCCQPVNPELLETATSALLSYTSTKYITPFSRLNVSTCWYYY
jgi:hypothetical protein